MSKKCIIVYTAPTFTEVLDYLNRMEYEYNVYDITYEYEIFYRIMFKDYRIVIKVDYED